MSAFLKQQAESKHVVSKDGYLPPFPIEVSFNYHIPILNNFFGPLWPDITFHKIYLIKKCVLDIL